MPTALLPWSAYAAAAALLLLSRASLVLLAAYHVPLVLPDLYNAIDYRPLSPVQLARSVAIFFALPEAGARIVLERFGVAGPAALVALLAGAGAEGQASFARSQRWLRYASAFGQARSALDRPLMKFVLFSLVPALPLFRLRQWLTYGGTFGEYHQFGLKAYLTGFAAFWALSAVYLLLFAAALRAVGEAIAVAGLWALPGREAGVRRGIERVLRAAYYLVPPSLLTVRLLLP